MTADDFAAWKEELDEELLVNYGVDLSDIEVSDDELKVLAKRSPACMVVDDLAQRRKLSIKMGYAHGL